MKEITLSHSNLIERYPALEACKNEIITVIEYMLESFEHNGKLIVFGNGGSSADAEHFCGELMKGFILKRKLSETERSMFNGIDESIPAKLQGALPAISLGVAHSTQSAFINDADPQYVYAQQVWGLANKNDIVFGISTSGNSANVIHALNVAKAKKVRTVALTGETGGNIKSNVDCCICAPAAQTHIVQELHLPIYHAICLEIEHFFFGLS